jgi:hypothetical protein
VKPKMDALARGLQQIGEEAISAEGKHGDENAEHAEEAWGDVVQKQLLDYRKALASRNPAAARRELSQIGAAALLAMAHLEDK